MSLPYGLMSAEVERAAVAAGYRAGLRVGGDWPASGDEDRAFSLPRYNVPAGLSRRGFRRRIDGLFRG